MRTIKDLHRGVRAVFLFLGIAVLFSAPALVRCSGEVDPNSQSANQYVSADLNR